MQNKEEKSPAPALDFGLEILEMLRDSSKGLQFNQIVDKSSTSKATVVRLLKVLRNRGYISKVPKSGSYILGQETISFGDREQFLDILAIESEPYLERISEETGNTAIIFYRDDKRLKPLLKRMHPSSIVMQKTGYWNRDLTINPWGWITIAEISSEKNESLSNVLSRFSGAFTVSADIIQYYEKNGFTFDDEFIYPGIRRICAPIKDKSNVCIGQIAIGGTTGSIKDEDVNLIGLALKNIAVEISDLWMGIIKNH